MKRNPAANCGNCPYWELIEKSLGECRQDNAKVIDQDDGALVFPLTTDYEWCGQHPDFWEQAEITNICPSCWPASDVGAQSTTYCPHCGKATTSTFEQGQATTMTLENITPDCDGTRKDNIHGV